MCGVTKCLDFGIGVEQYDYGITSNQISIIYILLIVYKIVLQNKKCTSTWQKITIYLVNIYHNV